MAKTKKELYKAYPTGLEGVSTRELYGMGASYNTPLQEHIIIAEEFRRRKEVARDG